MWLHCTWYWQRALKPVRVSFAPCHACCLLCNFTCTIIGTAKYSWKSILCLPCIIFMWPTLKEFEIKIAVCRMAAMLSLTHCHTHVVVIQLQYSLAVTFVSSGCQSHMLSYLNILSANRQEMSVNDIFSRESVISSITTPEGVVKSIWIEVFVKCILTTKTPPSGLTTNSLWKQRFHQRNGWRLIDIVGSNGGIYSRFWLIKSHSISQI